MTTEIDLLPLPEWMSRYAIPTDGFEYGEGEMLDDCMRDYARANVARNTALLRAEIKALREGEEVWKRVAAAEAELRGKAEERAERLAEALRHQRWCRTCAEDGWESCEEGRKNDALLREQEEGHEQ